MTIINQLTIKTKPYEKIMIAISATVVLIGAIITFSNVSSKSLPEAKTTTTSLLRLYVDVSQVPDLCGVEPPCSVYVHVQQPLGTDIATPQYYTGPQTYTFEVPENTQGYVTATLSTNYPTGGCNCDITFAHDPETGPPYPTFRISIQ